MRQIGIAVLPDWMQREPLLDIPAKDAAPGFNHQQVSEKRKLTAVLQNN